MTTIKVFIQYEQDPTQYLATEISKPACNSLRLPPSAHQVVVLQPGVVQQSRADPSISRLPYYTAVMRDHY